MITSRSIWCRQSRPRDTGNDPSRVLASPMDPNRASNARSRPHLLVGVVIALALALAACAPGTRLFDASVTFDVTPVVRAGVLVVTIPADRPSGGVTVRPRSAETFRIPPGHYPPPGQCRIWVPNRPPGQQSPPGTCADLERRVPAGAYLVYG